MGGLNIVSYPAGRRTPCEVANAGGAGGGPVCGWGHGPGCAELGVAGDGAAGPEYSHFWGVACHGALPGVVGVANFPGEEVLSFLFFDCWALESRISIRFFSEASNRSHVGIQASRASRHSGLDASSPLFSFCSARNFWRCFVMISTLRRTECHEYGCPNA